MNYAFPGISIEKNVSDMFSYMPYFVVCYPEFQSRSDKKLIFIVCSNIECTCVYKYMDMYTNH